MISEKEFDKVIDRFENNFNERYNDQRKKMLYVELLWLEGKELKDVFNTMLFNYNQNNLPTIREIKMAAHFIAPDAISLDRLDQFKAPQAV